MEVQINYALKLKVCKTILHIKFFSCFAEKTDILKIGRRRHLVTSKLIEVFYN